MAGALVLTHTTVGPWILPGPAQAVAGVVAGLGIGVVAAILLISAIKLARQAPPGLQ